MSHKSNLSKKLALFPLTAAAKDNAHLHIGGCDVVELIEEYGTPLYVFDEFTIRARCQEFRDAFCKLYADTLVIYASKAFLNPVIATIINEEKLGLDVVSGGELSIAKAVCFPSEKIYFHGNNKALGELRLALDSGVGRIVVDNLDELELLNRLAMEVNVEQDIMLRLNPGVDPHTHRYTTTGILDSKFGFPIATGQAEAAIARAISMCNVKLVGLHFHLGSPINDVSAYQIAIELVLRFAQEMNSKYGLVLKEFSPGGGFAVRYTQDDTSVLSIADYAQAILSKLMSTLDELGLPRPRCVIEPGRSIIAQAGVALYTVGAIKEIPGVRKYVAIDGGMGDNIRPALYEAKYEALVANKLDGEAWDKVTIAGRYCESGDVLVKDVIVPSIAIGDILAVPVSGAYCIPMSSNYNVVPRPGIIMVKDGKARLIRRRESYQDIMRLDVA